MFKGRGIRSSGVLKRFGWFLLIWFCGICVLGIVVYLLRFFMNSIGLGA
jgi:hypothetical protein